MALSDPQSLTVGGTATPLPRTGLALDQGGFADSTGQLALTIQHSKGKRVRHVIRAQKSAIVADPLVPNINQNISYSAHIVIDTPRNGVSIDTAADLADALAKWATPANLKKVLAGES